MGNGVCYKRFHEKGAWYECECLMGKIIYKKRCGMDCNSETSLLKAWRKYPVYREACEKMMKKLGLSDADLEA